MLKFKSLLLLNVFLISLLILGGCATMGRYSLDYPPTESTRSYVNIEVAPIEVGITKDELDPATVSELRYAIIEKVQRLGIYQKVQAEPISDDRTLLIKCKIYELDNGSQFLRWLLGWGAGKAYMETLCQFIDKKTNKVISSGTFSGEIRGGFFGGSADQEKMAKDVAGAIARFLKKGK
ncbi:MAG: DUF4410 domain-containing protein [Calditrichaeota bacterium]|nr:DUF4410 domain-containing protein [Calditrichota bacterium]